MPLSAMLAESEIVVTFDKPIVAQPLDTANWTTDLGAVIDADVTGAETVTLRIPDGSEPMNVSYAATPADVVGAPPNDLDVEAFTHFPVT